MVILYIQKNIRQKIDNTKIVNMTNISYISNSYQGILVSIDTRFFTASKNNLLFASPSIRRPTLNCQVLFAMFLYNIQ